jgi:hypothetical protein
METHHMTRFSICLAILFLVGCSSTPSQTVYQSPGAAVDSLVGALRANDTAKLEKIFGPDGVDIISSGDPVADRNDFQKFLQAYDAGHTMVISDAENRQVTLQIGPDAWPFPVPIVKVDKGWMFDADAGSEEILNRRIGRNELDTIQVCLAVVDAEHEYARLDPTKAGLPVYAEKIISDPGSKTGLYWPTGEGEDPSPLGQLVAKAADEGYRPSTQNEEGEKAPFHGYHYRLLKSQGPGAPGGAIDYMVDGKLVAGFALIAYPADYGNSGIMTFIVNHDGDVYQKDLGEDTAQVVKKITAYDPSNGWAQVSPTETEPEK